MVDGYLTRHLFVGGVEIDDFEPAFDGFAQRGDELMRHGLTRRHHDAVNVVLTENVAKAVGRSQCDGCDGSLVCRYSSAGWPNRVLAVIA